MSNLAHVKLDSHMPLTYLGLVVYVNVYGRHNLSQVFTTGLQGSRQSMLGTDYVSAINVHIHVCRSAVPTAAMSLVGWWHNYENQA